MVTATSVRVGSVVLIDKEFCKVIESITHMGGGKTGAMVHMKLRNLSTGHVAERRFAPDDKIEDIPLRRIKMQYLYNEGGTYQFMNPESFDQAPISKNAIGPAAGFLKENDVIEVEFYEEKPLSVLYPPTAELRVSSTGAGLRGHTDSTMKDAALENGMSVKVPQFVKEGDRVRVDVESGKYIERVMEREEKGRKFTTESPATKPSTSKTEPKQANAPLSKGAGKPLNLE